MREFWFHADDGSRLFALERGRGPALFLLHGGLADHRACAPLADPLADRFRVITPDLRASPTTSPRSPATSTCARRNRRHLIRHRRRPARRAPLVRQWAILRLLAASGRSRLP